MRAYKYILLGIGAVLLLASCTGHRTASDPEPDGDTVEVIISTQDE